MNDVWKLNCIKRQIIFRYKTAYDFFCFFTFLTRMEKLDDIDSLVSAVLFKLKKLLKGLLWLFSFKAHK